MKTLSVKRAVLAAIVAATVPRVAAQATEPRQLAAERGCTTCHEITLRAPGSVPAPPLGPPWPEVAARYRGDPAAEDVLVQAIVRGTAGRHWKLRSGFDGMSAQGDWIGPVEARFLVRWILAMESRP